MLHDLGGSGHPILLLHGLMGSARTWRRQVPWLRELGHVHAFDAAGHGRAAPPQLTTEAFVTDLAEHVRGLGPMVVIGHSMGGLHGWFFASQCPESVRGLVVEDMAPDFRGQTAAGWAAVISAWPTFATETHIVEFFGDVAGQYFLDSFERRDDGWHLHGEVETFRDISEEWGTRHFWDQWAEVTAPTLLIEAEFTVTPAGQMARMHALKQEVGRRPGGMAQSLYSLVQGAGHLVHDDKPDDYRRLVEGFIRTLPRE